MVLVAKQVIYLVCCVNIYCNYNYRGWSIQCLHSRGGSTEDRFWNISSSFVFLLWSNLGKVMWLELCSMNYIVIQQFICLFVLVCFTVGRGFWSDDTCSFVSCTEMWLEFRWSPNGDHYHGSYINHAVQCYKVHWLYVGCVFWSIDWQSGMGHTCWQIREEKGLAIDPCISKCIFYMCVYACACTVYVNILREKEVYENQVLT